MSMTTKKEDTRNIYQRMADIMAAVDWIGKDQKNTSQGFQYRGIDDMYNALHRIFAEHKVFVAPRVLNKTREERTTKNGAVLAFTCLEMEYTFYAPDGSHVTCTVEGEGMDSGDKSSNKAMSVAQKYALIQVLLIPTAETKDQDGESFEITGEKITEDQARELKKLIALTNSNQTQFLKFCGADSIQNIPANCYDKAITALKAKQANQ